MPGANGRPLSGYASTRDDLQGDIVTRPKSAPKGRVYWPDAREDVESQLDLHLADEAIDQIAVDAITPNAEADSLSSGSGGDNVYFPTPAPEGSSSRSLSTDAHPQPEQHVIPEDLRPPPPPQLCGLG